MKSGSSPHQFARLHGHIWLDMFCILSMDAVGEYYPDLGIGRVRREVVQQCLRHEIEARPKLFDDQTRDKFEELQGIAEIVNALGITLWTWESLIFRKWMEEVYTLVPSDRWQWYPYQSFFWFWSGVMKRDRCDKTGIFDRPAQLYGLFQRDVWRSSRELEERINETRLIPLSVWDQHVCTTRRYTLDRKRIDYETLFDPFGWIEPTVELYYFQRFWKHLIAKCTDTDLSNLHEACAALMRSRNIVVDDLTVPQKLLPSSIVT